MFPSRSDARDVPMDHSTCRTVYNSATPSSASETTPISASFTTPSSVSDSVWLRQYSSGSILPTVFEDPSSVDTREVSVEIHDDLVPPNDGEMNVAEQSSREQQENSSVEDMTAELDENKRETEGDMDNQEAAEAKEISLPLKPRPKFQVELTKHRVTIAEGPPTSIPVRVPYSSPQTNSADTSTSAPAKPLLSLPLRQSSTSTETRPNIGQKLLTQPSRGGSTPGDEVLTLQARRGFKLKLRMPTS